jgi:UDP-N-acetylmuramate--alanine ligase
LKNVYLIGIGGIGMSALARYFMHQGRPVAGYDRTRTPLTEMLENEGAQIHYHDDSFLIPALFADNERDTLVIYTPAVGSDNKELDFFRKNGNKVVKRAEALGVIAAEKKLLAVAGTHGKTTTSTMLAHILTHTGMGCNAFLGGISKNYNSNLLLAQSDLLVAEADEYDRSFMQLFPDVAIVTAVDADHLDISGSHDEVKKSFKNFINQIKPAGTLIIKKSLVGNGKPSFMQYFDRKLYTYSYNEPADFYAANIKPLAGGYFSFDLITPSGAARGCTVGTPGWINVENAVAAAAAAWVAGVSVLQLPAALKSFQGVKRRFDVQLSTPAVTYIDDYAHHPEELRAAITSLRGMFPNKKITGIFQPHLYTRTRDFATEFAQSLSLLDELILLDIYPARERPIEGVTSSIILDKVSIEHKMLCSKEELLEVLTGRQPEVLVTLGAGNIETLVAPIREMFSSLSC